MTCEEIKLVLESHGMTTSDPSCNYDNCIYLRWYSPLLSKDGLENVWGTAYYNPNTKQIKKIMKWTKIQKINGCKVLSFSGNTTGSLNQVTPNRLNKLCNQIKKNVKEFLIKQKLDKIQDDFN